MAEAPKPSERRKRLGKTERAAAQQRHAAQQQPLPDETISVTTRPPLIHGKVVSQDERVGHGLFALLSERNDGVLKICPTENPMACYSYWRWSRGRWSGHYVCSLSSIYELGTALAVLRQRVEDVEMGNRKPTKDRYQG